MPFIETRSDDNSPLLVSLPHSGLIQEWGAETPGHEDFEMSLSELPAYVRENLRALEGEPIASVIETFRGGVDVAAPAMLDWENLEGLSRVWTRVPRTVLDVNRGVEDVDAESVEETQTELAQPQGVIWRIAIKKALTRLGYFWGMTGKGKRGESLLNRPYTQKEYADLIRSFHKPYIDAVRNLAGRIIAEHGDAVILDIHTFPPLMPGSITKGPDEGGYVVGPPLLKHGDLTPWNLFAKRQFPDALLITDAAPDGTPRSCHPEIANVIREAFKRHNLILATGKGPFQGDKGSPVLYRREDGNAHVAALEVVSHGFEIGRDIGALRVDPDKIQSIQLAFKDIINDLNNWENPDK